MTAGLGGVVMHGSVADMVSVKDGAQEAEALDIDVAGMALLNFRSIKTIESPLWVGSYGITGVPGHWLGGMVE